MVPDEGPGRRPDPGYVVTPAEGLTIEHMDLSQGTAGRVAALFREAEAAVEARLGLALPEDPHVVVAPNDAEFARRYSELARGREPSATVLAVAFTHRDLVILRESGLREGTQAGLESTLRHELAHLALGRLEAHRGRRLPRWLNEGLAEWASGRVLTSQEASAVEGWARFGQIPPLDALAERFPDHGQAGARAYTTSFSFMTWVDEHGGVRSLVAALARGASVQEAFREVTALPPDEAELEWRADLIEDHSVLEGIVYSFNVWALIGLLAVVAMLRHVWVTRRLKREMALEELEADEADGAEEEDHPPSDAEASDRSPEGRPAPPGS